MALTRKRRKSDSNEYERVPTLWGLLILALLTASALSVFVLLLHLLFG